MKMINGDMGNVEISSANSVGSGIVLIIIGVVLVVFGFALINNYNSNINNYIETEATVISHNYNSDGLAAIIVEYYVDGEKYEKTSNLYSDTPDSIGVTVNIWYNKDDPTDVIWEGSNLYNMILPFVGVVFIIGGVLALKKK